MTTIVLTNRNRDLRIVKQCLESLRRQTCKSFLVYLVDYGSDEEYLISLDLLVKEYDFVFFLPFPVSGQLWNKSRAINTVLKLCKTEFFFVADIDMIFSNEFIDSLDKIKALDKVIYFQVGFLSQQESLKMKKFDDYKINFLSNREATGMTLFPTHILLSINGYDEFYHGWGAEDTDVHIRLENLGYEVEFYSEKVLLKHQWHPKIYRSSESKEPFHLNLEFFNNRYLLNNIKCRIKTANTIGEYGLIPINEEYKKLKKKGIQILISNEVGEIDAFLNGNIFNLEKGTYEVVFSRHRKEGSVKNKIKKILNWKNLNFYSLEEVNNKVLMTIIMCFRNNPYHFEYKRLEDRIVLKIVL